MSMTANQCLMQGRIFLAHWNQLELETGDALTLRDGTVKASFETKLQALEGDIEAARGAQDGQGTASANLADQRDELLELLKRFRQAALYHLRETPYAHNLPTVPHLTLAESGFFAPFDAASARWAEIDQLALGVVEGFTAPLTLRGGTTRAQFDAAIADVRLSQQGRANHAEAADSLQARRDARVAPLRKKMTGYRDAVLYRFGSDSPHTETLPALE